MERVIIKISSMGLICMSQPVKKSHIKKFAFVDKTTEEATKIKYTIKIILEFFRDFFSADACYLYLTSAGMDEDEKKEIFVERLEEMKEAYEKEKVKFTNNDDKKVIITDVNVANNDDKKVLAPNQLIEDDFKILKFIDVSQKTKEDGTNYWNYDYRTRPRKYVIFTKYKDATEDEKPISNKDIIYNEGITSYVYRINKPDINIKEDHDKNISSASLNSLHNIKPPSACSIGIPLCNKKGTIGVLTVEFYDKKRNYNKEELSKKVLEVQEEYLPLLVELINVSKPKFKKDSYEKLFRGMNLLISLKNLDKDAIEKSPINKKIYKDTLHLFYVLKRKEYVGYEEILGRVAEYANDVSKHLELSSESKPFTDFLEKFKRHEELLLYGLNDFRDHFMHQFHVFVSGYIIINLIGFKEFKEKIISSMTNAFDKSQEQLKISDFNILRIWFLVSFFHDHAYIFEKLHEELKNFFKSTFDEEFTVNFNWEQLLKKESEFSTYLTDLQNIFSKQEKTNPDAIMKNYLDSIISKHDHGVLSALLLLHYFSDYKNISLDHGSIKHDCLYAAFAISVHNQYENLMEKGLTQISFESFPIAFLLSYCDTAQSFGRIGKRQGYPSRFVGIDYSDDYSDKKRIAYKIEYLEGNKIPTPQLIEEWAKKAHNTFKSSDYFFDIENYETDKKHICTLSYGYYKQPISQPNAQPFITVCPVNVEIENEDSIEYCKVNKEGYPIFESNVNPSKAMVILGKAKVITDQNEIKIKVTQNDKAFLCSLVGQGCLSSVGKELAGEIITVIFHSEKSEVQVDSLILREAVGMGISIEEIIKPSMEKNISEKFDADILMLPIEIKSPKSSQWWFNPKINKELKEKFPNIRMECYSNDENVSSDDKILSLGPIKINPLIALTENGKIAIQEFINRNYSAFNIQGTFYSRNHNNTFSTYEYNGRALDFKF